MILAFETSAKAAGVALLAEGKLLGESYQNTGLTHSQTLMSMAEDLLKNCGKTPADVTAVAVANGPGSFTGVRIGVAAAKGFAWGAEIPCYGVSTLEAMAEGLGVYDGFVVPTMDARRSQTYTAIFRAEGGKLTRILDDCAISFEELGEKLKNCEKPIFLVGDGASLCYNTLKEAVPELVLPPEHRVNQRASGVALVAQRMIDANLPGDGAGLTPNYLRLSQAERERLAREEK
ncbi:MAG: tRNA (adenosine(37)-N6)-threonylcarbamoyltransferase complex dimerization subunit type 1 TsaB [Oscillospiraceae bacterium]|nr:tRNA (adenosine(37)-N6)-threonylcarbamoyltransferase complex dimerization subunit type 1 TsaB [Oscillospiraceae bacterium]